MFAEVGSQASSVRFGPFLLRPAEMSLLRHGAPVEISARPLRVLLYLVARPGVLISREELRREIWGEEIIFGFDDRLNTAVATIRSTLHDNAMNPSYIQTVRGRGYRFIGPVSMSEDRRATEQRRAFPTKAAVLLGAVGLLAAVIVSAAHPARTTEISNLVVSADDPLAPQTTSDPKAWSLYLQASTLTRNMREADYRDAISLLEQAVERDSTFALGYSRLAIAAATLTWYYADLSMRGRAEIAAQRAITLAPERAEPWLALGLARYYGSRDYDAALVALRQAETISRDNAEVLSMIGWVLRRQGQWSDAAHYLRRAAKADPHSLEIQRSLGQTYAWLRDFDSAKRHLRVALSVSPTRTELYLDLAELALRSGDGTPTAFHILQVGALRTSVPLETLILSSPLLTRVLADQVPTRTLPAGHFESPREDIGDAGRTDLAVAWLTARQGNFVGARRLYASLRQRLLTREQERGVRGLSEEHANLAFATAALGLHDETLLETDRILTEYPPQWDAMHSGRLRLRVAETLVIAGEENRALDILSELLATPSPVSAALLRVDPIWDPLRHTPRFQGLVGES